MDDTDSSIDLGEKGFSFKEIVMQKFKLCGDCLSVEFRGGYYSDSVLESGGFSSSYIPDSREVSCNSILVLTIYLLPRFDEKALKDFEDFQDFLKILNNEFYEKVNSSEQVVFCSDYYLSDEDKESLEVYKIRKLRLHVELFVSVSKLLGRKNYLEIGGAGFE